MMAQAIVTVLIVLIFIGYAVFFAIWNPGTIEITSLYIQQGLSWGATVQVFVIPLIGAVFGAILMALTISAPWSSLKAKLGAAEDRLEAERTRSKERARKNEALKSRVLKLQAQLEPASPEAEDVVVVDEGGEFDLSEPDEV